MKILKLKRKNFLKLKNFEIEKKVETEKTR